MYQIQLGLSALLPSKHVSVNDFTMEPHVQLQLLPFNCINQDMTEISSSMHLPITQFLSCQHFHHRNSCKIGQSYPGNLITVLTLSLLENTYLIRQFNIDYSTHFIHSSIKTLDKTFCMQSCH